VSGVSASGGVPAHAGGQPLYLETQGRERPGEQAVVLEAVAPAATVDQLGVHRLGRNVDSALQEHVDRLERDRGGMQAMQGAQRRQAGVARAVVADAGEIGVEVGHAPNLGCASAIARALVPRRSLPSGVEVESHVAVEGALGGPAFVDGDVQEEVARAV